MAPDVRLGGQPLGGGRVVDDGPPEPGDGGGGPGVAVDAGRVQQVTGDDRPVVVVSHEDRQSPVRLATVKSPGV